MSLTRSEIEEIKALLAERKKVRAKPKGRPMVTKLLVGPHGRIVGRVSVQAGERPPAGHSFIDDQPAQVGQRVLGGKPVKPGRKIVMVKRDGGEIVNRIVADENDPPEGYEVE